MYSLSDTVDVQRTCFMDQKFKPLDQHTLTKKFVKH